MHESSQDLQLKIEMVRENDRGKANTMRDLERQPCPIPDPNDIGELGRLVSKQKIISWPNVVDCRDLRNHILPFNIRGLGDDSTLSHVFAFMRHEYRLAI